MASVSAKKVFKSYGDVAVVHGIDLDIEDGSFVVLLGPSGCGKSTLLRMIAGLESVTKGDIEIAGKRVNDVHPKDRNIAMVFQNYALYAHMNVADNMSFSLKLAKRPQSEVDQKVSWAAKILNLEPYLKRYPRELSGGQRQRVAMGRAIVRDPAVFLFDEPLSNLDAKLRVQMRTEIKELHERLKTTTVYVTHDQIEAMTMADRIVILRDGRIEQIGSPLEVYDHPVNLFVATFIGSPAMNLLKGETVKADGGIAVRSGDVLLPLPKSNEVEAGRKVIYGVRPEHLDPVSGSGGLPATISVTEPTGPEIHIYAELAGEEICAITDERRELKRGETLGLQPRLDRIHLFDAESGRAIL
ncbi:sn-glycerol-3-phosphate ABC transporter ATP-binding protein UgpC [Nordella sp. HKS 07]|uniref:ABC transporter ATP-binding protein n=1 Tax=Nordella sp. HKS 07 TaxID=2712222 RepID=UPI0013E125C8|nr:sn-glycerol-3-phosphate ABC transporter ATP-binding protein UgpC [Nordella sp. HKS 07]QIG47909.1 sn-glycerol-3-phosphate ABC transporter ATP-binding protein UgpC [Nordella sp. HKS 07]